METDTLDADGAVTATAPTDGIEDEAIASAMAAKVGESEQRPPAYSAVKVGGRKLYEAARSGDRLEAPARPIRVDRLELVRREADLVWFVATVSGGTYVRVLAADVGQSARLRRPPDRASPDGDRLVRGRGGDVARGSRSAAPARARGRASSAVPFGA